MLVKSIKACFYGGHLYEPGQAFRLPEGVKPSRDMEIVSEEEAPVAKPQAKEVDTFSGLNRERSKAEGEAMKGKETGPKGK